MTRALRASCLIAGCLIFGSCAAPAAADELVGWEYRWGDSPRDTAGAYTWTRETAGWASIGFPSNPPDREGRQWAWYRVRLPRSSARDRALFITSIDLAAELFVDGERVYTFGLDPEPAFRGWPWHLVRLPTGTGEGWLHVRVWSDYRDIGLWGIVTQGERSELLGALWVRDLPRLLLSVVSVTLGLALLLLALLATEKRMLPVYLGLAMITLAARVAARTYVKQLLWDASLPWEYFKHLSVFFVAVLTTLSVREVVEGWARRLAAILAGVLVGAAILSSALSLTGVARVIDCYVVTDATLWASLLALLFLTIRAAVLGDPEARILAIHFSVIILLVGYALGVSNGLLPWADDIDYIIVFCFSLGLFLLMGRRMHLMRGQLVRLNTELESKVTERTRELEHANRLLQDEKQVLQTVSITDSLTGMRNRMYVLERLRLAVRHAARYQEPLALIMFDLDHFKEVNDTWGHQAGDDVLRRVAAIFTATLRDSDLAGRYGGEEFVVLLPKADQSEARQVAERLRVRVEELRIAAASTRLTVSGGIATWHGQTEEELLAEADRLLYRAKEMGRNRIEVGTPDGA